MPLIILLSKDWLDEVPGIFIVCPANILSALSIFGLASIIASTVVLLASAILVRLSPEQILETFCNGNFEDTFSWGKGRAEITDCKYVWTDSQNGKVYEGEILESEPSTTCFLRTKAEGKSIDPPKKECLQEIIFKTGGNEWKTFRDGKLDKTTTKI